MRTYRVVSSLFLGMTMFAACGGDDEEESPPPQNQATVNEQLVQQNATLTYQAVNEAVQSDNGQEAAFSLAGIATTGMGMVTAGGGATPTSVPGEIGSVQQASGTCDCSGTSCTFDGCSGSGGGTTVTLSGTISWANNTLLCNLDYSATYSGYQFSWHTDCNLTVTSSSLNGTLGTAGSYNINSGGYQVSVGWDTDMTYDNVQYNSSGCPTSGSIGVSGTVTTQGVTYNAGATVTFTGQGC